jgi:alpha-galactosidase
MKKNFIIACCLLAALAINAQEIVISKAKFQKGDNMEWRQNAFDDNAWPTLSVNKLWTEQGVTNPDNYAWYRMKVVIPRTLLTSSDVKDIVNISVAKVDDCDETYLNGTLIGKTGSMPGDKNGFQLAYDAPRNYKVNPKLIKWDQENVIAVRVYNGNDPGGIYDDNIRISVPNLHRRTQHADGQHRGPSGLLQCAAVQSVHPCPEGLPAHRANRRNGKGQKHYDQEDNAGRKEVDDAVAALQPARDDESAPHLYRRAERQATGPLVVPKYILTLPTPPLTPRYNGALVYGVRPGSPVIFKMAFSGEKPMKYSIKNLPDGLTVNADNGRHLRLAGRSRRLRDDLRCRDSKGRTEQKFTLKVGDQIALTPPMGWNSWNCWGLSVSQEKVISSAQAILDKGLADYGYSYINIDDSWEAKARNADGTIAVNEKFPDMKKLGDWLHGQGLKFGIYSSPGDYTCGGYLGSIDHEEQDAQTYNSWGIDYLKYDWCGYGREYAKHNDHSVAAFVRPYLKMEQYLREQPRDIFYSLCQYGMADVWKWGHAVDANSWRTTGDITDTWESLSDIGFRLQAALYPYAGPGHWNDPDMLIVGKVGWSANLRDTRLTADEQYTHISLWSLLASNLLIGCDVAQMDDFTRALLCNNEVNAVNQDVLGQQAKREVQDGDTQIWKRQLADGSYALGIFNLGADGCTVDLATYFTPLGIKSLTSVRDLWRQKDLSTTDTVYYIPSHGVRYLKVRY